MKKGQKDSIIKVLSEIRTNYTRYCNTRISEEQGNSAGANYMIHRSIDALDNNLEDSAIDSQEKDEITKTLTDNLTDYVINCNRRVSEEYGKIMGANYMYQEVLDTLNTEEEEEKSTAMNTENNTADTYTKKEVDEIVTKLTDKINTQETEIANKADSRDITEYFTSLEKRISALDMMNNNNCK